MKIITDNPIINYSQSHLYSNLDDDTKKALVGTGIATGGALMAGLAAKGRKPLTDIEQKCGKKPKFNKAKKQQYNDCISKANSPIEQTQSIPNTTNMVLEKKGMSMGTKIGIGLGVALLVGVGVYMAIKGKKVK